ncbi:hypothetical protein C8J56DRAFT_1130724 [Mycena floridula]|nr:hypothetical protein C8J56DRAFT_1130724 [Mycena floridula]
MKIKLAWLGFRWVLDEDWSHTYNRLEENEQAIYSQIVFRGLRLKDKDVHTEIQFQLPTEVFREYASSGDLRASISVISPLEEGDDSGLTRSTDKRHRTEAKLALASFALSHYNQAGRGQCIRNEQLFQDYPFIITRTQLRVAKKTHRFNTEAFDKTRSQPGRYICFSNCRRQYQYQGHLETLFELSVPSETAESGFQTEYAYPPYLSHYLLLVSVTCSSRLFWTSFVCQFLKKRSSMLRQRLASSAAQKQIRILHEHYTGVPPLMAIYAPTIK